MKLRKSRIEQGSNNIFADLGFADAESHLLKAQIVAEIYRLATTRKLTQAQIQAWNAGNLYVNVHTARNKGGEVRGQITP